MKKGSLAPDAGGSPGLIISRADAVLCPMIEMISIAFIFIKQNKSKMLDEKYNSCGKTRQLHDTDHRAGAKTN